MNTDHFGSSFGYMSFTDNRASYDMNGSVGNTDHCGNNSSICDLMSTDPCGSYGSYGYADTLELRPMQLPLSKTGPGGSDDYYNEADHLTGTVHHRVAYSTATRLRIAAIIISWGSVVFSLTTGIVALVFSTINHSQSLFGYGLDAVLDAISSVVVLWRFYGTDRSVYSAHRERIACIVIGCLFLVAAACLAGKSINAIITQSKEEHTDLLYGLAICNMSVSVILATTKVILGYKLESKALITDSVITYTGFAVSLGTLLSLLVSDVNTTLWYMDPVIGLLCGIFLLGWGIKLLIELVCCYRGKDTS